MGGGSEGARQVCGLISVAAIAVPLALATVAIGGWQRRRIADLLAFRPSVLAGTSTDPMRYLFIAILMWLALRFALLLLDVVWTPLYPWDAWIQWATKARVWYALGQIVPFGRSEAWFAANGEPIDCPRPSLHLR